MLNQTLWSRELLAVRGFFRFWLLESPTWFFERSIRAIGELESTFAVRSMSQHLAEPIFQDYTRAGRLLGFFIRLLRIIIGVLFYFLVLLVFAAAAFIWLVFPVIAVWQIFSAILIF